MGADNDRPWVQAQITMLEAQIKALDELLKAVAERVLPRPPLPDGGPKK